MQNEGEREYMQYVFVSFKHENIDLASACCFRSGEVERSRRCLSPDRSVGRSRGRRASVAAQALGMVNDPAAALALIEALRDSEANVRERTGDAL